MTQEETPNPKDKGGASAASGKSKRKIVVSHTPLKSKHTDDAIHYGHADTEQVSAAVFDEEALLHPSAAAQPAAEPVFHPIQPPPPEPDAPIKQSGGGLALFFSFVAFIGVAVFGYFGSELYFQLRELVPGQGVNGIQAEAQRQTTLITQLQTELSTGKQTAEAFKSEQADKLTQLQAALKSTQDRMTEVTGRTDEGWVLAEAQYLVRMANERLTAMQDVDTAIHQLNAADDRLKQLGDPSLRTVREAIAKDVAKLKTVERPDREGMWLTLGRLETEITALPLTKLKLSDASDTSAAVIDSAAPMWKKAAFHSWQEIKSLIRVRHHDGAISLPILSDSEGATLQHAVQLQIAETRLALLQGNAVLYQGSLKTLQNWLDLYFENSPARNQIKTELDTLSRATITVQVPDLAATLSSVNAALMRKDRGLSYPQDPSAPSQEVN